MKHLAFAWTLLFLVIPVLTAQTNPVPFINQPLVPETVPPGSSGFTLTVNGSGFAPTAVVKWNNAVRATAVLSPTQLQASIRAADVATARTAMVTVVNLDSHNETSNVAYFTVRKSAPTVAMIASPTFSATGSVVVGDFNNDKRLDVVVLSPQGNSFVADAYLGEGDLQFQSPIESTFTGHHVLPPINRATPFVGDFNGDHNLDIAVLFQVGKWTWDFAILLGDGTGKFKIGPTVPIIHQIGVSTEVGMFPAGDMNGDGNLDVIVSVTSFPTSFVTLFFGDGHGAFPTSANINEGKVRGSPTTIVVGDFNEDGNLDLAIANGGGPIRVALNPGNGQFSNFATYHLPLGASFLVAADVNGDGHLDLVADSGGVLLGKGDGTFKVGNDGVPTKGRLTLGDFNGDDKLDLLFLGDTGLVLGLGNGDGTFQPAVTISNQFPTTPFASGDFNHDGHLDLVGSGVLFWQVPAGLYPSGLVFGDQNVGTQSPPQPATLVNAGSTPLVVTQIAITGTDATQFSQTNNCPSSIPVGGSCQIQVVFAPTNAGYKTASLTVTYTGPGSPQSVALAGTAVAVGTVSLLPANLDFGTRIVGTTSAPQTATLTNTGSIPVNISSIATASPFIQTNNCPASLPVGQSCQIQVTFRPTQNGPVKGTLTVKDDAQNSPQTVALSGTGTKITLLPIGINFGQQKVGTSSNPSKVTLSNNGTSTLNISNIAIGGTDPGDFSQTNDCGKVLPVGSHCTFQVVFTPTQTGSRSAKLQVFDDAEPSPQEVALGGTGT